MLIRCLIVALALLSPTAAWAARCFSNGNEINVTTSQSLWDNLTNSGIGATGALSGSFGLNITSLASGTARGARGVGSCGTAATTNVRYARARFRFITLPSSTGSSILALGGSAYSGYAAYVKVLDTGALELFDEDGSIGSTSAGVVAAGTTQYVIELHVDGSPGAGSDVVSLRVDGSTLVTSSARTIDTNTFSGVIVGGNLQLEAQTTGQWYIDDVGVNNTTGSNDASWPGDYRIINLFVTGDGTTTYRGTQGVDWETCTSNTDPCTTGQSGNAWEQVDDANTGTDSGSTAIHILTTSTAETDAPVLLFNVTDASSTIDSNDVVKFVQVKANIGSPTSGTRNYVLMCKSGSSYCSQNTASIAGTTYTWDQGVITPAELLAYVDPATSAAWTGTAIDSMEAGVRAGSDSTPLNALSMVMVLVEYQPVANAGSIPSGSLLRGFLR